MSYSKYTDEEIIETYNTIAEYGSKIDKAFINEIQTRGGIDAIKEAVKEKNKFQDERDRKVLQQYNNGTTVKAFVAVAISTILCIVISFVTLFTIDRFSLVLFAVLVIISFGIIKLITGKSSSNVVVLIATILSAVLGVVFGWLILDLITGAAGEFYG